MTKTSSYTSPHKTLLAMSVLALAACSGGGSQNDTRSVDFGDRTVSWVNFARVSDLHRQSFEFGQGESLYMFTRQGNQTVTLSNGAVVKPGGCIRAAGAASTPPNYNTALREECEAKVRALPDTNAGLSRADLVALAERAVRQEGSCQWLGYDPAIDARARALGSLARSGDDRLFFAKLNCG